VQEEEMLASEAIKQLVDLISCHGDQRVVEVVPEQCTISQSIVAPLEAVTCENLTEFDGKPAFVMSF
jgi:hypothetical protein